MCFLATLFFRILNISTSSQIDPVTKQVYSKFVCNILFQFLRYCKSDNMYYPLRALVEYFNLTQRDVSQSKRLNAESLLMYKH